MAQEKGKLSGYNAVITGGSSGIGFAIAEAFAQHGASVWLAARDEGKLDEARQQLRTNGAEVRLTAADLSESEGVSRVAEAVTSEWPSLDVLVNNAALGRFEPFEDVEEDTLRYLFSLNVYAPYRLTQHLLPALAEAGSNTGDRDTTGSVINMSSHFGQRIIPLIPTSAYSATKGALNALTKALAVELGPRGVRVNAIAPGTTQTPAVEHNIGRLPEEQREAFSAYVDQHYPMGRLGTPSDISGLAVYLASDEARWVTGDIINVDGGLTAN